MSATDAPENWQVENGANAIRCADAAHLLEQALDAGCQIDRAIYLLALAYKRQGKGADAHNALGRIANPDAHVFLLTGLLALKDQHLVHADQQFAPALQMHPALFAPPSTLPRTRLPIARA